MSKLLTSFCVAVVMASACTHTGDEEVTSENRSIPMQDNPSGVWQAVWVKGFDPDWPTAAEAPFDWSQNQLQTNPDDPGDWGKFSAGCNKLWRYREPVNDNREEMAWRVWPGLEACTELVNNGQAEILARSMLLERALAAHIVNRPDRRLDYQIDEEGLLIWLDGKGHPVARFKPIPD